MEKDVTFEHPDYAEALPDWDRVEDATAGERQIKAKKDRYLPRPNKEDKSQENLTRYEQYRERAVYYNASGRTVSGLTGVAFSKPPQIKAPASMTEWMTDVTGSGVPMTQHAQATLAEIIKTGRGGILVDYPRTDGNVSVAQQQQAGVRPTLCFYPATAITNWRTRKRGSEVLYSMVVLLETHESRDESGFGTKREPQYRVLRFDDVYQVEIWRKQKDSKGEEKWLEVLDERSTPIMGDGAAWKQIPFQMIGSRNNDIEIDPSPMIDIANLNIAHYRNSADYEDSVYMVGQGQVWMSGLDEQWVKMLREQGIYFGSRSPLPLPQGGQAGLLQMQPNSLCKGAMDQKEAQMAALGARLLMRGSADAATRTATETNSDDATAHSVLSLCCVNVSSAYAQAMQWAADFANVAGSVEFSINTEFTSVKVDAQMLTAMVGAVQSGTMALADFWARLREAGIIKAERTDDQIREEIEQQQPANTGGIQDDDVEADEEAETGEA